MTSSEMPLLTKASPATFSLETHKKIQVPIFLGREPPGQLWR